MSIVAIQAFVVTISSFMEIMLLKSDLTEIKEVITLTMKVLDEFLRTMDGTEATLVYEYLKQRSLNIYTTPEVNILLADKLKHMEEKYGQIT